jgi:hypothetical protein
MLFMMMMSFLLFAYAFFFFLLGDLSVVYSLNGVAQFVGIITFISCPLALEGAVGFVIFM